MKLCQCCFAALFESQIGHFELCQYGKLNIKIYIETDYFNVQRKVPDLYSYGIVSHTIYDMVKYELHCKELKYLGRITSQRFQMDLSPIPYFTIP